jgi:glycosyltransferase involved in cell wall biosynthesis
MTERHNVRVTHLVFDFEGGGMESLVGAMVRRWSGTPVKMSVVTLGGRPGRTGAAVQDALDQFHVLRPARGGLSMILPLGIARALRRTRADVVHLHSGAWFKGAWAARLARVSHVVYTEHGREHRDTPASLWLDRQASRLTDVIVTVSERLQAYMERTVGVSPARLRTISNGVDTTRFAPGPAAESLRGGLGIPASAWVVGSVGRLESVKAYHRLIEALGRLRAAGLVRPVHLVICGEGTERAELESYIVRAGLRDFVKLPGWTDDPVSWYRLFDVFALSSDSEGLSVSLLEAMACGCAPVVTDVGANAHVLGPALHGQVVPPGSVDTLVDALAATLGTEGLRTELGVAARARVEAEFSLERMVGEYERLYRELVMRPTAGARRPEGPVAEGIGGAGRRR